MRFDPDVRHHDHRPGFHDHGGAIRNPTTANQQYPWTSTAIHTCGQYWAAWCGRFGPTSTVCTRRRRRSTRHASSLSIGEITAGGQGLYSVHPTTAIEMLTADDDDAVLANGTPHYCQIAAAFASHGISSPSLSLKLLYSLPDGLPNARRPTRRRRCGSSLRRTARRRLRTRAAPYHRANAAASYTATPMTQVGTNEYLAQIPGGACGETTQFYFEVGSSAGVVPFPNSGCAASSTSIRVGYEGDVASDDFEQDRGWTVGTTTATTGAWVRVDPLGTRPAAPSDDHTDTGTTCWVTGNGTNANNPGEADIDGGLTTLVSPAYDASGFTDATISYYRWYSNAAGSSPNNDTFRVEVSTNNGSTWRTRRRRGRAILAERGRLAVRGMVALVAEPDAHGAGQGAVHRGGCRIGLAGRGGDR